MYKREEKMAAVLVVFLAAVSVVYSSDDGRSDFIKCGYKRCDRKVDYCDHVMSECVPCVSVCRPAQHPAMDRLCEMECPQYLELRRIEQAKTTITPLNEQNITVAPESGNVQASTEQHGPNAVIMIVVLAGISVLSVILIGTVLQLKFKLYTCDQRTEQTQTSDAENQREQATGTSAVAMVSTETETEMPLLSDEQRLPLTPPAEGSSYDRTLHGRKVARPEQDSGIDDASAAHQTTAENTDAENSDAASAASAAAAAAPAAETAAAAEATASEAAVSPHPVIISPSQLPGPQPLRTDDWVADHAHQDDFSDLKQHDQLETDPHTAYHPSQFPSFQPNSSFHELRSDDSISCAGAPAARHGGQH